MQLPPLAAARFASMPVRAVEAPPCPGHRADAASVPPFRRIAPAGVPVALEGAVDGAARAWSGPLIDFPGIEPGDQFDIVKGSKVGFLGVRGDARILSLGDDDATFHVKAGALGMRVDVEVQVVRTGADTVEISSRGSGIPDTTARGRIVSQRTNHVEFERIDDPSEKTVIRHDGHGNIVIDTVVPTLGAAHLRLDRR